MKFKFIVFLMFLATVLTGANSYAITGDSGGMIEWNPGGSYLEIGYLRICPDRRLAASPSIPGGKREMYYPRTPSDCNGYSLCPTSSCNETGYFYTCYCNAGYKVINQGASNCSCQVCDKDTYSDTSSTSTNCTQCPQHKGITGTTATAHNSASKCTYITQCPTNQYGYNRSDYVGTDKGCKDCPVGINDADGNEYKGYTNFSGTISDTNNTYTVSACKFGGGSTSSRQYKDEFGIYVVESPCTGR